ncbi:MAG: hypothetical protein ACON4U_12245 [Myxococcota bacterium]
MATRRATRSFESTQAFMDAYEGELTNRSLSLPAKSYRGKEIANSIKLDIVVPDYDRIGPISATVVFRAPDGSVAVQLEELPEQIATVYEDIKKSRFGAVQPYIDSGLVVLAAEYEALKQSFEALQADIPNQVQAAVQQALSELNKQHEDELQKLRSELANRPVGGGGQQRTFTRGLIIPPTEHLTPSHTASFEKGEYLDFLMKISSGFKTGLLVIQDGQQTRYGYFEKGSPMAWRSEPLIQDEVLGMLLLQAKQITEEQVGESLRIMEEKQIRQGEAFMELKLITYPQLIMILGKQVEFIFDRTINMKTGSALFYELENLPETFIVPKISLGSVLYRRRYTESRHMSFDEIGRFTAAHINHYVYYTEQAHQFVETMGLTKEEAKLAKIIGTKPYRLREIFSISPLSRSKTSSFFYAFDSFGLFEYSETEGGVRSREQFAERVRSLVRVLQRGSLFDILEVHWICLPNEVEKAYQNKKAEFSDERLGSLLQEYDSEIAQIRNQVKKAYQMLKTDSSRREYRLKVVERDLIMNSADLLSKKGEMAIMRFDKREACACFSKALELMPNKSEFREGLRRATVLSG